MLIIYYVLEGIHWILVVFNFDGDPIYDDANEFRFKTVELFPLEHTSICINYSYFWKQGNDTFT
jgi:hypothetical protein